jgi:hypothetical protein
MKEDPRLTKRMETGHGTSAKEMDPGERYMPYSTHST